MALSLLGAVLACILTLYRPSLSPPGLHPRALQLAAASTEILVATPNLAVSGSADYAALVNRATLVGNVMVSPPVLAYVARAVGVSADRIQATAPMTANVPRALLDPGSGGNATDIISSPDNYKLEVQADPSVPILHIYAQGPTKAAALHLATASVAGVSTYLEQMQTTHKIPLRKRVGVEQLGDAKGGVANPGGGTEIAILMFIGVFGVSMWVMTIAARIRRGWTAARLTHQPQS